MDCWGYLGSRPTQKGDEDDSSSREKPIWCKGRHRGSHAWTKREINELTSMNT